MNDSKIQYTYPLLSKIFSNFSSSQKAKEYYLVCCQHIQETQKEMFRRLIAFGFDPKKIIVLGKIYSTSFDVLDELKVMGITALQPKFSGQAFDQEHENNCRQLLDMVPREASCILLDDGGQLIQIFSADNRKVDFAVEQTSSGFRRLEKESLDFPVETWHDRQLNLFKKAHLLPGMPMNVLKAISS